MRKSDTLVIQGSCLFQNTELTIKNGNQQMEYYILTQQYSHKQYELSTTFARMHSTNAKNI